MRRYRRADADRRAVLVERHDNLAGVQLQARTASARRRAVDRVAQDRPAHFRAMHAKLMGAAGERFEREPGEFLTLPCGGRVDGEAVGVGCTCPYPTCRRQVDLPPTGGGEGIPPHHLPPRPRRLAFGVMLHPPAARDVEAAERQRDLTFVCIGGAPDHGPVGLVDGAVLEQLAGLGERLAVTAEHQAAGVVGADPVRPRRRPRQAEAQRVEVVFEALAAVRAAVHRKACRLVDHQHQAVAIQEPRHHLFRGHCCVHCRNRYHGRLMDDSATKTTGNWWQRLAGGLKKSSSALGSAIAHVVAKRQLDSATIDEIEDELVRADLGAETAGRIATELRYGRFDTAITPDEIKAAVAAEVEKVRAGGGEPVTTHPAIKPFGILVAGVNGSGKTTTIGKLAARLRAEGRTVMLAAGDTFRAAAIDPLKIWAGRSGGSFIAREAGADAAGLVYDAVEAAKQKNVDVLLIDTAGRLQNRTELMGELEKMVRVMKKVEPAAPHAVLLVLDATVGQNALSQVEIFGKLVGVTGLVMTKLDGTARGGILVAIAEKFKVPVHFIGVGESVDDLAPFSARDFARAIVGLVS